MREITISKFKASCLDIIEDVQKTGVPMSITKSGKTVAEIVPASAKTRRKKIRLGGMAGTMEILGDIVGPIYAFGRMEEESPRPTDVR